MKILLVVLFFSMNSVWALTGDQKAKIISVVYDGMKTHYVKDSGVKMKLSVYWAKKEIDHNGIPKKLDLSCKTSYVSKSKSLYNYACILSQLREDESRIWGVKVPIRSLQMGDSRSYTLDSGNTLELAD